MSDLIFAVLFCAADKYIFFMINLTEAKLNKDYYVSGFSGLPDKIFRRLCDLGLTEGEKVCVRAKSLMKKALLIEVRGYELSLKADIAKGVMLK